MDIQETLTRQLPLYARVLVKKGICLQKDQILVINAPVEASSFSTLLTEEAYRAGASQVVFNWYCNGTTRLRYEYETQDKFESVPGWRSEFNLYYYRKGAAFLSLISADPYAMKGIDRNKIMAWQKAFHQAVKEYSDGMMASKTNWLGGRRPQYRLGPPAVSGSAGTGRKGPAVDPAAGCGPVPGRRPAGGLGQASGRAETAAGMADRPAVHCPGI